MSAQILQAASFEHRCGTAGCGEVEEGIFVQVRSVRGWNERFEIGVIGRWLEGGGYRRRRRGVGDGLVVGVTKRDKSGLRVCSSFGWHLQMLSILERV